MDELTRRRLEHNEEVFRAVNEEIDAAADESGARRYICECADTSCTEVIRLTHDEYRRVRGHADQYVVVPGHELPTLETVVAREPGHLIVEKG